MIECGRHELKMEDGEVKYKVHEHCRDNGELGCSMKEQAKEVGENH